MKGGILSEIIELTGGGELLWKREEEFGADGVEKFAHLQQMLKFLCSLRNRWICFVGTVICKVIPLLILNCLNVKIQNTDYVKIKFHLL